MILCSCNILSDRDVRGVVEAPASVRTVAEVYGRLECNPKCGRCAPSIRRIIGEIRCPTAALTA